MRNLTAILIITSLLFLGCKKDKQIDNIPFNPFDDLIEGESQFFDLDTVSLKEITGKYGTKIYFERSFFDVDELEKITLELKEFYKLRDLIKNNIRTITNENELLESSGVIYLDFKKNGVSIDLKDSVNINLRFPKELSNRDKLFIGEIDSIGQTSWMELETKVSFMKFNIKWQIDELFETTLDSLPYYQDLWKKQDSILSELEDNYNEIDSKLNPIFSINKLGWINIDKFVESTFLKNIDLEITTGVDGLVVYFIYPTLNSFNSYYPQEVDKISLKKVPIVDKTNIIIVGQKNNILYAKKIELGENYKIKTELKEISLNKLEKLLSE
ncbi:MAG: hypothetical protein V3U92_06010 [Cellulophaga sp.]